MFVPKDLRLSTRPAIIFRSWSLPTLCYSRRKSANVSPRSFRQKVWIRRLESCLTFQRNKNSATQNTRTHEIRFRVTGSAIEFSIQRFDGTNECSSRKLKRDAAMGL